MDKIEKIRQEIEQLRKLIDDHNYYLDNPEQALGYGLALDDIGRFLDTLSEEPGVDVTDFCKPIDPGIAQCVADHWHEMLGEVDKHPKNTLPPSKECDHGLREPLESEEPDKSLKEAAEEYADTICPVDYPESFNDEQLRNAFIAGAEWQARQLLQGSPMPEDTVLFNNGVAEGRRLEREDILNDAVEGEVIKTDKHTSVRYKSFYGTDRYFYGIADKQLKPGDKVRIVVLKAEEE